MEYLKLQLYFLISVISASILALITLLMKIFHMGRTEQQLQRENNDIKVLNNIQDKVIEVSNNTNILSMDEMVDSFKKDEM